MRRCLRGCGQRVAYAGLCRGHYRKHLAAGLCGRVDVGPVAQHIARLRSLGWTWTMIGQAAQVSQMVPHRIHFEGQQTVTMQVARALLAIEPRLVASSLRVDATGTRRRVEALACMGWTRTEIARRVGREPTMLTTALSIGRITAATAVLVQRVYRELSDVEGTSSFARSRARTKGWVPPIAWDDDTIDDPEARPNTTGYDEQTVRAVMRGEPVPATVVDRAEAIERLRESGLRNAEILRLPGMHKRLVYGEQAGRGAA